jgi:hypothetical protein
MRFLYCGGGGSNRGPDLSQTKWFGWASSDGSGRIDKIIDIGVPKLIDVVGGAIVSKEIENAATEEEKRYRKEQAERALNQRKTLIDRQRQQLVTSGQVNPLFTPASLGGKRRGKAPFSTPPITGERLG